MSDCSIYVAKQLVDQLRGDPHLCFRTSKNRFSNDAALSSEIMETKFEK